MDFLIDFIKTNLLQLLNLLILTVFGAAGWKIVQESKKNLEERYKAELAKRDVQIQSLKSKNEDLLSKHQAELATRDVQVESLKSKNEDLQSKHQIEVEKLDAKIEGLQQIHQAEQAERQAKHQAEITVSEGETQRLKSKIEHLERQSVLSAGTMIEGYEKYAEQAQNLVEQTNLELEEKNRIIEELTKKLEQPQEIIEEVVKLTELFNSDSPFYSDSPSVRISAREVQNRAAQILKQISTPESVKALAEWQSKQLNEFDELKKEIDYALSFYASAYSNPGMSRDADEAQRELRRLASQLKASFNAIPSELRENLPSEKDVMDASGKLIRLSNIVTDRTFLSRGTTGEGLEIIIEDPKTIRKLLGIKDDGN